jgi:hypothetical protein
VATNRCRICNANTTPTRCVANQSSQESCIDDGSAWGDSLSCNGKGCLSDRCNQCTPNADQQCAAGGSGRQGCQADGTWGTAQSCPNGCTAGVCRECPTTGQTRCVTAGSSKVETCNAAGSWEETRSCTACNQAGTDCAVDAGLFMFTTLPGSYKGNLGGRSGADALCVTAKAASFASLACTHVRAFLSVNLADEIRDMPINYSVPTNLPVKRPNGTVIDSSFPSLLAGGIMSSAAPFLGRDSFWGGSTEDGSLLQTCGGWTISDGSDGGTLGSMTATDDHWLLKGGWSCEFDFPLVCLCW